MAPLADAVRLVDREQKHLLTGEQFHELTVPDALRRDVHEADAPAANHGLGPSFLIRGQGTVHVYGPDVFSGKGLHLVLHEADQGRDHHGDALRYSGRERVEQGLSPARGHNRHHVSALHHVPEDRLLPGQERVVPEFFLQDLFCLIE